MIGEIAAEFDVMLRMRIIIEIKFACPVPDGGAEADIETILFPVKSKTIIVENGSRV